MNIDESVLRDFALSHHFQFLRDPFHGSTGFEFRKADANKIESIGFIFSADAVEVYHRITGRAEELVHEKLWPIEPLLKPLLRLEETSYRKLEELPSKDFDAARVIAAVERHFGLKS
jgi:hypothetical protein